MAFPPSSITTERISMATDRPIIGVDDRVPVAKAIPLGIQHFMSMFGSTVLVPFLTGLSPSLAIMCRHGHYFVPAGNPRQNSQLILIFPSRSSRPSPWWHRAKASAP